jgi:hypothetical protein
VAFFLAPLPARPGKHNARNGLIWSIFFPCFMWFVYKRHGRDAVEAISPVILAAFSHRDSGEGAARSTMAKHTE